MYSVFPSLQVSWKIAAALDAVGTIDQDRTTAVVRPARAAAAHDPGRGAPALAARRASACSASAWSRTSCSRRSLAYVSLLSVLQGHERAFGAATLRVDARLALAGGREVRVEDVVASEQPAQQAAAVVAGPLALLVANDFEKVTVETLDVDGRRRREPRDARRSCGPGSTRPLPLRPGSVVPVRVQLRTHRGETRHRDAPGRGPASAHRRQLHAARRRRAATMDQVEQREMRQAFVPRDLDQLVRALNRLRPGNRIYARLTRAGGGADRGRRVPAGAARPPCSRC